jgi:hypothetical protein
MDYNGAFVFGGYNSTNFMYYGGFNLKYIEIEVDGVEVFSGNKTGIDTIKPDDYTVVGTPTISADGIMTASSGHYIEKTFDFNNTSNYRVEFSYYKGSTSTSGRLVVAGGLYIYQATSGQAQLFFANNGVDTLLKTFEPTEIGMYNFFIKRNGSTFTIGYKKAEQTTYTEYPQTPETINISSTIRIFSGVTGLKTDLNTFKVWTDGNLVYQPCLKIPYTQTKDGKKIVDSIYRDRVEDEYNQAGFTPYYTLDTESRGNYAVVGSPNISSDFVASGFSNSNYLTSAITITNNDTLDIDVTFTYNTEDYFQDVFVFGTSQVRVFCNKQGNSISTNIGDGTIIHEASKATLGNPVAGDIIRVKLNMTSTTAMTEMYVNGVLKTNFSPKTGQTYNIASSSLSIGRRSSSEIFRSSIDLKQFKIYVDNKLAYQAVIPPNYTMATVEEDDIVASSDGATSYTQRADLSIEQQGTTTSGTTVTFSKPFMDTNYALSIPYSAKTVTGFTAAANGDYIAEGYTSL